VKYYRSDEWSTNRNETKMGVSGDLNWILGVKFHFGRRESINAFKQRQRQFIRPLDLFPYYQSILGKRQSLIQLQKFLVEIWIEELTSAYAIALSVTHEEYADMMLTVRELVLQRTRGISSSLSVLIKNCGKFRKLMKVLGELSEQDQLIMIAPFVTTIDSSILNFTANPEPVKEFSELFHNAPIKFIPIEQPSGMGIIDLVPNAVNNPGNSVFGPKGFICPGNTITSMLLKSVADLKRMYRVEMEGKPKFLDDTAIKSISNSEEIFLTFHERDPAELAEFTAEQHNFLKHTTDED